MNRLRALALFLSALPLSAAAPAGNADISGIWMVESIDGKAPVYTGASIEFGRDSLMATAGCNAINGGYALREGRLVATNLVQTLMACANVKNDEDAIGTVLRGSPLIDRKDDRLILKTAAHSLSLRERR